MRKNAILFGAALALAGCELGGLRLLSPTQVQWQDQSQGMEPCETPCEAGDVAPGEAPLEVQVSVDPGGSAFVLTVVDALPGELYLLTVGGVPALLDELGDPINPYTSGARVNLPAGIYVVQLQSLLTGRTSEVLTVTLTS